MIPITINQEDNRKQDSDFYRLIQMLMPPPLTLDAAPTTLGLQLPNHLDNGFYSTDWYINLGGTVRKIAFTNV